jgi:hypothetical protein
MPPQSEQKMVNLRLPNLGPIDVAELGAAVRRSRACAPAPFHASITEFCSAFAARLFSDPEARRSGELQSLAFFMRRGRIEELKRRFEGREAPDSILAPRGVAFHIPPANVSAMLVYSWLMAVVTGNVNVIRIPSNPTNEHRTLLRIWNELISTSDTPMSGNTYIVEYGHDEEISAALSAMADIRVIWGGDHTVNRLRSVPLPPGSKELTFPDKHSLALISAAHYRIAGDSARDRLALAFFADTFWFDQMACSSPRLLVWHGDPAESRPLSEDFFGRLTQEIGRRKYNSKLHTALTKEAFAYAAILDQGVTAYHRYNNELTVLTVDGLNGLTREHCGGGLLFQFFTRDLTPVLEFATRRDQTLSHFNYSRLELIQIANQLRGSAIDRIVPIGQALAFDSTWDGYDLLQEFSRRVFVRAE